MTNNSLPIASFRDEIIAEVRQNPVTVITAETGAGKSTQVPQYLLDEGYDLVVTQPRRLAARTVAQRVAEEIGETLGGIVGYRTAVDRQDSPSTRALFCTDGLALVRELMGQNRGILVLDEVHEWNENMEVLVAWAKRQIESGADFKVVLMSATMEAEKLSAFFNGAPVISVPGRLYPVLEATPTKLTRDELVGVDVGDRIIATVLSRPERGGLEEDVVHLLNRGHNVLVFQPGKAEINATISALEAMKVNAEILPLHGQLTPEEQAKCFKHYGRPKVVVSTNVAQTSVTIDDIDAVVDSGMERRIELVDGVEGLYLKPISLADAIQRKGRAGRTKEGIYIDHCGASSRPDFPVAEILRKRLDQTVLRLAIAGFDMEELEFFHQPDKSDIHDARRTLVGLGCMSADGSVTRIGKLVNRLPVSVQYARMLVEADRLGVVDDVLTVAAIMEMGGITVPPPSRNRPDRPDWRRMVPDEHESDVMGQLSVWEQAENMTKDEMRERGISIRDYFRAKEIRRHLAQAVKQFFRFGSTGRREDILKAVCAGMVDHLWRSIGYTDYVNGGTDHRQLGSASCVRSAEWVVGKPFDLQIKTRRGMMTLKLIELASKVDPMWLAEVAPQLVRSETGLDPRYSPEKDSVVSTTKVFFQDQLIQEKAVPDPGQEKADRYFTGWLVKQEKLADLMTVCEKAEEISRVLAENAARRQRARELNVRAGEDVFRVYSNDGLFEFYLGQLAGARSLGEISKPEVLRLPPIEEDLVKLVLTENPDRIEILGESLAVEYVDSHRYGSSGPPLANPRVRLSEGVLADSRWLELPDEGVNLPSGRSVEIVVYVNYTSISNTDIPQLKEKVRKHLNESQWSGWKDRPEVAVPDPAVEGSQVPFITASYGKCVVTGEELTAYGTCRYQSGYYKSGWEVAWYRDLAEAEATRAKSAEKLEAIRAEERKKRELAEVKAQAEAAREELKGLSSREEWDDLEYELRSRASSQWSSWLPSSVEELGDWTAKTKAMMAEVEAGLTEAAHKRELEEQVRQRRGVILQEIYSLGDRYGWPQAHIFVSDDGDVFVNGGKTSKVGRFEVDPAGEAELPYDNCPSLDESGRERAWHAIPANQMVTCQDYSGSGNLKSECTFQVPEGLLDTGVWAVTESEGELVFYPVIYYRGGEEIIPDEVVVRRATLSETERELAQLRAEQKRYLEEVEEIQPLVDHGYAHRLTFRLGKHPKTGEEQWEAGSKESRVKFILDRYDGFPVAEGREYFCEEARTLVDVPGFKLILVKVLLEAGREPELEAEIASLEAKQREERGEAVSEVSEEAPTSKESQNGSDELASKLAALKKKWGA